MSTDVRGVRPRLGVVIVHPLETVGAALSLLVAGEPDLRLVGTASEADAALLMMRTAWSMSRWVVLIDLSLKGDPDAFSLMRSVVHEFRSATVVAIGMDAGEIAITRVLVSAASGFVHLGAPPGRFLDAIRRAAAGEEVLEGVPIEAISGIVDHLDRRGAMEGFLTEREAQVLTVASEGLTAREVGQRLGVRERTVTTHLSNIYRKLGARGKFAALAAFSGGGLVDPDVWT